MISEWGNDSVEPEVAGVTTAYNKTKLGNAERVHIQYTDGGNEFIPVTKTREKLEPGVYTPQITMTGVLFVKKNISTDELLKFDDSNYNWLFNEVQQFWGLKDSFDGLGFTHKRGILMYGKPGTGKSCLIKQLMMEIINEGDIVFSVKDSGALVSGLTAFREVEPDRRVFVVIEDIDSLCEYGGERRLLELFDGDGQIDNVLYIATTNYINKLPERMLRVGRFDKMFEVKYPNESGRRAYLGYKLSKNKKYEADIDELVKETDGLGFNHLKELLISVYCLKNNKTETIKRLKSAAISGGGSIISERKKEPTEFDDWGHQTGTGVDDPVSLKKILSDRIATLKVASITVDSVDVDQDGDTLVTLSDEDGDQMQVLFGVDVDDTPFAMIFDDEDDENLVVIDLDTVGAPVSMSPYGNKSVDFSNPRWLNYTTLTSILRAGELGKSAVKVSDKGKPDTKKAPSLDAFGYTIVGGEGKFDAVEYHLNGKMYEVIFNRVVLGKRAARLPLIRYKNKESMSSPRHRECFGKKIPSSMKRVRSLKMYKMESLTMAQKILNMLEEETAAQRIAAQIAVVGNGLFKGKEFRSVVDSRFGSTQVMVTFADVPKGSPEIDALNSDVNFMVSIGGFTPDGNIDSAVKLKSHLFRGSVTKSEWDKAIKAVGGKTTPGKEALYVVEPEKMVEFIKVFLSVVNALIEK